MSENEIIFRLTRNNAGQVIDGLTVCHENWQETLDRYKGKLEDPHFVILECNDCEEVARIAENHSDLVESLQRQLRK